MKRTGLLFFICSLSLFGMSYETFKAKTLKNSKILKSQTLNLQTAQQQNNILLRAANPTLNLELSNYNEKAGGSDVEYAAGISQTIRTGSYMNGLQEKANATSLLSKAFVTQGRAGYIKTLESLYIQYVFQSKMLTLLKQEYALSKRVTAMVKERYESGSENRVAYLQAKTETLTLKTQMYTTKQQLAKLYYQLLAVAGLTKKVSLEKKFIYSVSSKTKNSAKLSPQQQVLKAKEELYRSDYSINQSSFRNFDLYAGVEQEPDQGIVRVGVSIPLSINNNRSEERKLAKLKMHQARLDNEQLTINIRSQKQMLKAATRELSQQYDALKGLQNEQQELTTLLQEGYKIAKGSLFQLMSAKNKLIQTKKALLQTQKMINDQKIELHFLQGYYND